MKYKGKKLMTIYNTIGTIVDTEYLKDYQKYRVTTLDTEGRYDNKIMSKIEIEENLLEDLIEFKGGK